MRIDPVVAGSTLLCLTFLFGSLSHLSLQVFVSPFSSDLCLTFLFRSVSSFSSRPDITVLVDWASLTYLSLGVLGVTFSLSFCKVCVGRYQGFKVFEVLLSFFVPGGLESKVTFTERIPYKQVHKY